MKSSGWLLIVIWASLTTTACANQVNVPKDIKVKVEAPTDTTVHVIHEIDVSVEMQAAFEDDCKTELGPVATELELEACKNNKIQEYVEQFMDLLNAANNSQQGGV